LNFNTSGVPELIEAFKLIKDRSIQLVIAGKTYPDEVEQKIRVQIEGHENIHFHPGFVPDQQIQVFMNASDVVVLPYRNILTSGGVILAMSFAKACIAPRKCCLGEVLDNSGAFLYDLELEIIKSLETTIGLAIQNQSQLFCMGRYNRRKVEQWDWKLVARMTLNVYHQCLSH
jgi:glycosyltransferase involved in cell wall biosynthesis